MLHDPHKATWLRHTENCGKQHSPLGASVSHRFINCSGSVRMSRGFGSQETRYTLTGTKEHEIVARALTEGCDPRDSLGQEYGDGMRVTPAMVHAAQLCVEFCEQKIDGADRHWVEQQFSLDAYGPPAPMYGTCDFAAYYARRQRLDIVDFKFGHTWVPANSNSQLQYYALGIVSELAELPVSRISMTIIQPHFTNADPIRTWSIDAVELAEFSFKLIERARAALEPDAPTIAGDWCKFCPAKGVCLAYQNARSEQAYPQFSLAEC
jgi:uncharacterized protein DUF2800